MLDRVANGGHEFAGENELVMAKFIRQHERAERCRLLLFYVYGFPFRSGIWKSCKTERMARVPPSPTLTPVPPTRGHQQRRVGDDDYHHSL